MDGIRILEAGYDKIEELRKEWEDHQKLEAKTKIFREAMKPAEIVDKKKEVR